MTTKMDTGKTDIEKAAATLDGRIVTIHDIAERLGVPRVTVEKWKQRAKISSYNEPAELARGGTMTFAFPAPRWVVANGRTSLWLYEDVEQWLIDTERPVDKAGKLIVSAARRK